MEIPYELKKTINNLWREYPEYEFIVKDNLIINTPFIIEKKESKKKIVKLKIPSINEQIIDNIYKRTDPNTILLFKTINEIIDFINNQ